MAKTNALLLWTALAVSSLALMNLPAAFARRVRAGMRESAAPLHEAISGFGSRLREALSVLRGLGGQAAENRRLNAEVAHLRRRLRELEALATENQALRELLQFQRADDRALLAAQVIARDAGGWWQTLRLDRGAFDGVRAGQAVITADGLVGRVRETSSRTADVLLISDPNCRVSVRLPRTEAMGILSGRGVRPDGLGRCRVDFIHRHLEIRPGDEVVTSGLGGVFPPGLPVGYVEEVTRDEQGLYLSADVIPHADIGHVRYVFVILDGAHPGEGGGAP